LAFDYLYRLYIDNQFYIVLETFSHIKCPKAASTNV
jgi:hypothetical protein